MQATINNANLYYEVKGEGEPLLLLHAGVADSRMYDDQVETFAQHYRVIRFDLRGFGQSTMPSGSFSNIADVGALLDHLDVQATYILGISFGGLIALDFAITHPVRVKKLILGAPSVSGATPSERIKNFWDEEDEFLEKGDFESATELNLKLWVDGVHRTPKQVDVSVRQRVYEMQMKAFQADIPDDIEEIDLDPPAVGRLGDVETPTLILVGSLDLEEKLTQVDDMITKMPNARKAVIDDVAHMLNMEKPDEFNRYVLKFLAE
ncbi:MAG: alpha/beta hydrolase [Chloroflexota bacterium]